MVNKSDLTDEQMEKLLNNPEVVKTLNYEEMGIFDLSDTLAELQDAEHYDTFTQSVADRSGRVTQSTVEKVIRGMIDEAAEYDTDEEADEEADE